MGNKRKENYGYIVLFNSSVKVSTSVSLFDNIEEIAYVDEETTKVEVALAVAHKVQ